MYFTQGDALGWYGPPRWGWGAGERWVFAGLFFILFSRGAGLARVVVTGFCDLCFSSGMTNGAEARGQRPEARKTSPRSKILDAGTATQRVEGTIEQRSETPSEKLASVLRHLLSGGAAFLVDQGLLTAGQSDEVLRLVVAALVIVLMRAAMWAVARFAPGLGNLFEKGENVPAVVLCGIVTAVGAFGLVGCSSTGALGMIGQLEGKIYIRNPDTGAKGGIEFMPGKLPSGFVRVPVFGDEGELIGYGDLRSGSGGASAGVDRTGETPMPPSVTVGR